MTWGAPGAQFSPEHRPSVCKPQRPSLSWAWASRPLGLATSGANKQKSNLRKSPSAPGVSKRATRNVTRTGSPVLALCAPATCREKAVSRAWVPPHQGSPRFRLCHLEKGPGHFVITGQERLGSTALLTYTELSMCESFHGK